MALDSHEEVIHKFASRRINQRFRGCNWRGSNVFCEDKILYSYGRHFPLACYLGRDKGSHIFIKNGDKYSNSTSCHQTLTQRSCFGPTVSRSALMSANIRLEDLSFDQILFWRPDTTKAIMRKDGCFYDGKEKWTPPSQGMFILNIFRNGYEYGVWHTLGVVVIQNKGDYFLCSLDGNNYFVSQLASQPSSIEDAFEILKPEQVKLAEAKGLKVKRQGEWFFIPTGMSDSDLAKMEGSLVKDMKMAIKDESALPTNSNKIHRCKLYPVLPSQRIEMFARGTVSHRWKLDQAITGEHKSLRLGEEWHIVVHNAAVDSWSEGGVFD